MGVETITQWWEQMKRHIASDWAPAGDWRINWSQLHSNKSEQRVNLSGKMQGVKNHRLLSENRCRSQRFDNIDIQPLFCVTFGGKKKIPGGEPAGNGFINDYMPQYNSITNPSHFCDTFFHCSATKHPLLNHQSRKEITMKAFPCDVLCMVMCCTGCMNELDFWLLYMACQWSILHGRPVHIHVQ